MTPEAAREEAERLFADSLASVGISLGEIRQQAGEAFEMRSPGSGLLPFARAAQSTKVTRRQIAAEHVILGTPRNEHAQAPRLLAGMGIPA